VTSLTQPRLLELDDTLKLVNPNITTLVCHLGCTTRF